MVRTLLIIVLALSPGLLLGQSSTASQTLHLTVLPVATLAVSGDPMALAVQPTTAGDALLTAEDRSTSYRLSSNRTSLKISAVMDAPLPDGMRLLATFASSKGMSLGPVDLSNATQPATVVTAIGKGAETDQEIAYTLIVDAERVGPTSQQRKIFITLTE